MNDKKRPKYEAPVVAAVDARQLLEALGPAHCHYACPPTSEVRAVRGQSNGRWHRR